MAKWDADKIKEAYEELEAEKVLRLAYDNVNHPKHYGQGDIECIDYISDFLTYDEYVGYLRGNVTKYLHRWRYKNGLEDLKKAQWYLARLVEEVGYEENNTDQT
jgi:hypothetical protein